jgi:membrane protease YdiL (CAAX protease family)
MCLYPLLSVYPQALIFRALFVERYARIFASERTTLVVGALCFCLAHLPFRNLWALGFTCIGGFFFLRTYLRSKSLLLSCLEHALYGQMLFTVGWGAFLYHGGTQALLRSG